MNHEEFNKLLDQDLEHIKSVLASKATEYASDADRFHNFILGARLQNITPEQALRGYLTKHICSVFDMLNSDNAYPLDRWEEKIFDSVNYLLLLHGLLVESSQAKGTTHFRHVMSNDEEPVRNTQNNYLVRPDFTTLNNIFFATQNDAQVVKEALFQIILEYNRASVADLIELSGFTPSITDSRWGWTDVGRFVISYCARGYYFELPQPQPL